MEGRGGIASSDIFSKKDFKSGMSSSKNKTFHDMPKASNNRSSARQSVARPGDFKFTNGLSSPSKRTIGRSSVNKNFSLKKKCIKYLVIAGWCFCGILLLRLVFAERGVLDYYSGRSAYLRKERMLNEMIRENRSLEEEIKLIRSSSRYQKKLVRDNLGFISQEEFLVLFEKDS